MTRDLEQQPLFSKSSIGKEEAEQFGRVVDALQMVDPGLEYVSVSERGAIVYHKQARLAPEPGKSAGPTTNRPETVSMGRKKLWVTVTVQTRREHDQAIVTVSDEGPGIPRADRGRIFEIFFSRRPGGTGIGLALAKTAVENCGGAIDVETPSSGKGSRFVIRIPMRT